MLKQVIVIRKDLGMSVGKRCVQVAHASLGAYKKCRNTMARDWEADGEKKVVLEVNSKTELLDLKGKAEKYRIPVYLVQDAGLTEVKPGTYTALGIGPEDERLIDKVTGSVKLL
ncbi:aminoacyl-tRNA hydrolase [Candidatus Micrarchaeota archaeon RBG_16_49_10]|nr:MAG: aminoacyl-tRNA hydrolase [Candidatus Micrarchaeota archaeon RBG_16_49_10]